MQQLLRLSNIINVPRVFHEYWKVKHNLIAQCKYVDLYVGSTCDLIKLCEVRLEVSSQRSYGDKEMQTQSSERTQLCLLALNVWVLWT